MIVFRKCNFRNSMQVPELAIVEFDEKLAGILGRNQARIQCGRRPQPGMDRGLCAEVPAV